MNTMKMVWSHFIGLCSAITEIEEYCLVYWMTCNKAIYTFASKRFCSRYSFDVVQVNKILQHISDSILGRISIISIIWNHGLEKFSIKFKNWIDRVSMMKTHVCLSLFSPMQFWGRFLRAEYDSHAIGPYFKIIILYLLMCAHLWPFTPDNIDILCSAITMMKAAIRHTKPHSTRHKHQINIDETFNWIGK